MKIIIFNRHVVIKTTRIVLVGLLIRLTPIMVVPSTIRPFCTCPSKKAQRHVQHPELFFPGKQDMMGGGGTTTTKVNSMSSTSSSQSSLSLSFKEYCYNDNIYLKTNHLQNLQQHPNQFSCLVMYNPNLCEDHQTILYKIWVVPKKRVYKDVTI